MARITRKRNRVQHSPVRSDVLIPESDLDAVSDIEAAETASPTSQPTSLGDESLEDAEASDNPAESKTVAQGKRSLTDHEGDRMAKSFNEQVIDGVRATDEPMPLFVPPDDVIHSADDIRNSLKDGMAALTPLRETYTCTNLGGTSSAMQLPYVDVRYEVNDSTALRRIYTLALMKGNRILHNIGLAETADYFYAEKERYIRRVSPPGHAEFYLVGTVMLSLLLGGARDKNRQICLRPMWELLGRTTSFIGTLLKQNSYYVNTYKDGISFSSMMPPRDGKDKWDVKPRYNNMPVPYTPPGVDVPIFDGRATGFTLSSYQNLPRYDEELGVNSVAMVTFTVGAYPLPPEKVPDGAMLGMNSRVSLNIKHVLLLADRTIPLASRTPISVDHWGVVPVNEAGVSDILSSAGEIDEQVI